MTQKSFYGFTLWAVPRFHRGGAAQAVPGAQPVAEAREAQGNVVALPAAPSLAASLQVAEATV